MSITPSSDTEIDYNVTKNKKYTKKLNTNRNKQVDKSIKMENPIEVECTRCRKKRPPRFTKNGLIIKLCEKCSEIKRKENERKRKEREQGKKYFGKNWIELFSTKIKENSDIIPSDLYKKSLEIASSLQEILYNDKKE